MDKLSIREAVKHFQVSRPTLTKALKIGKVSGIQDGKGKWSIDPSELCRLYQPRSEAESAYPVNNVQNLTTQNTQQTSELAALKEQLAEAKMRAATAEVRAEAAEQIASERGKHIDDLRRMLPPPDQLNRRRWWLGRR